MLYFVWYSKRTCCDNKQNLAMLQMYVWPTSGFALSSFCGCIGFHMENIHNEWLYLGRGSVVSRRVQQVYRPLRHQCRYATHCTLLHNLFSLTKTTDPPSGFAWFVSGTHVSILWSTIYRVYAITTNHGSPLRRPRLRIP